MKSLTFLTALSMSSGLEPGSRWCSRISVAAFYEISNESGNAPNEEIPDYGNPEGYDLTMYDTLPAGGDLGLWGGCVSDA